MDIYGIKAKSRTGWKGETMAGKKKEAVPFRHETKITYNKYRPNRKARRLGIKPEEPQEKEEKTTASN